MNNISSFFLISNEPYTILEKKQATLDVYEFSFVAKPRGHKIRSECMILFSLHPIDLSTNLD